MLQGQGCELSGASLLAFPKYAKGLSFQEGNKGNWARLTEAAPEVLVGSSKYQNWELVS